jgi:hypothetical protein
LVYSLSSVIIVYTDIPLSSFSQTSLIVSVKVAAITAMGKQTFCEDPTALNSNLFPV